MASLSIPKNRSEVTAQWLEAALKAGSEKNLGSIASIELNQIGEGIGVMGELFRASITYASGTGPSAVIVKLPSQADANRQQGIDLGMYEAEVKFYDSLAAKTTARLPRSYYTASEAGTANFVILMEDLGHLSMVVQMDGMNAAQTSAAIRSLAALHASWWGKVETTEMEWVPSVIHDRIVNFGAMWPMLWEMYQPKFGHVLPEGAVEFGNWLSVNYWEAVKEFATSPWTLLHLDYRVDNLMFDTDLNSPDAVAVIDWQSVGRGPAGYDLAYLLGGSVTVEDRRKYEDQWLHEYHDEITRLGVSYAFEDLYKDYVRAHVIGGTSTAVLTGATFDLGNERGVALIASMGERHFAAPLDHNGRQFFSV